MAAPIDFGPPRDLDEQPDNPDDSRIASIEDTDSVDIDISRRFQEAQAERKREIAASVGNHDPSDVHVDDTQDEVGENTEDQPLFDMADTLEQLLFAGPLQGLANTVDAGVSLATLGNVDAGVGEAAREVLPEADSVSGDVGRAFGQFLGPLGIAGKALKVAGIASTTARSIVAGGIADFAAFSPNEERLSNIANEYGIGGEVTAYLAADDEDGLIEGRLKNVIEGLGLGAMGAVIFKSVKGVRAYRGAAKAMANTNPKGIDIHPEYMSRVDRTAEALMETRSRVDIGMSAREIQMSLEEGDPAFIKAREYLTAKAAGVAPEDLPKISDEGTQRLIDTAEFEVAEGLDPLNALNRRAIAAKELSPINLLQQENPELADILRGQLGAEVDDLQPGQLGSYVDSARADLRIALKEWKEVRTSADWDKLPPEVQEQIETAINANRRSAESGHRLLDEELGIDREIAEQLSREGRVKPTPPGTTRDTLDPNLDVTKADAPVGAKPRRTFLGGAAKMTADQRTRYLRAIAEGDVEGVGNAIGETINLTRVLNDDGQVEALLKEIERDFVKTKVPFEKMQELADAEIARIGGAAQDAAGALDNMLNQLMPKSTGTLATRALTLRTLEIATAQRVSDLGQIILRDGDIYAKGGLSSGSGGAVGKGYSARVVADFSQASEALLKINDARRGLVTDMARGLVSQRIKVGANGIDSEALAAIVREGGDPRWLARSMEMARGNSQKLLAVSRKQRAWDAAYGVWINGLLSGTLTHAVNTISNTAVLLTNPLEHGLGGLIDVARHGDFTRVQEAAFAYKDMIDHFGESVRMMSRAFAMGESQLGRAATQLEHKSALGPLQGYVDTAQTGFGKTTAHVLNTVTGLPGRLLISTDELARGLNYGVHIKRAARRAVSETHPTLRGVEKQQMVNDFAKNAQHWDEFSNTVSPAKRAQLRHVHERALEDAKVNTFTNDLAFNDNVTKSAGQTIQQAASRHPTLRVVLPFVRTPTNIFRYGLERVPVLGLAMKKNRELLASGSPDDIAKLVGKQMFGGMLTGAAVSMTMNGQMTGGGPREPGAKETWLLTHQPYSIRIGDAWVSFDRTDPFGMILGLTADVASLPREADTEPEIMELAGMITGKVVNQLGSKRYMTGAFNVFRAISQAEESGLENFIKNQAGSLVPNIFTQTNRALVDDDLKQLEDWKDAIVARIPGLSDTIAPRLNMFGETISVPPGYSADSLRDHESGQSSWTDAPLSMFLPFKVRSHSTNETRRELSDIGYKFSTKMAYAQIQGVDLTPEERNQWIKLTNNPRAGILSLEERFAKLMSMPIWDQLTNEAKVAELRKVHDKAKSNGALLLQQKNPEILSKVLEQKMLKAAKTEEGQDTIPDALQRLQSLNQ